MVRRYGTGQDTLRCLALATVEQPGRPEEMNLEDAKNFVQYEVSSSPSPKLDQWVWLTSLTERHDVCGCGRNVGPAQGGGAAVD